MKPESSAAETRYDKIKSYIESMSTRDIVTLHREYCIRGHYMDDYIYDMDEFDDIMQDCSPSYIAARCYYGDFCPANDYFGFDGYGNLFSFDTWKEDKARIYPSDIASFIDCNETDLGDDDIAEILETYNEDGTEREDESENEEE